MDGSAARNNVSKRHALHIALWVLQILLALVFAFAGSLKLIGVPQMVTFFTMLGVGQWFRYMVGSLELAGAIGLLIPRLSGLAALGLVGVMVGATATQVFILRYGQGIPIGFLLLSALVAWGRWPQTKALIGNLKLINTSHGDASP
ncbi:MAG: DoxX family protein [Candidatus Dormibacteraceae bacterium]